MLEEVMGFDSLVLWPVHLDCKMVMGFDSLVLDPMDYPLNVDLSSIRLVLGDQVD